MPDVLPRRAIDALLTGRHAAAHGRTIAARASHLARIAASYTHAELLAEQGIGEATAFHVGRWLAARGLSFRDSAPSADAETCPDILADRARAKGR